MNLDSTFEGQHYDNFGRMESANQKVNLLSRQGNIVATGYVLTGKEGEVFPYRIVQAYERKVFIEIVLDVLTPIWDPPQGDDQYLLFGYFTGGWLVWNEKGLQFVN
ncbi:hypothetical protein MKX01_030683 [Papaver californicum]|nr:hypothetical protein MKX01_030683 [Papaver californicum]